MLYVFKFELSWESPQKSTQAEGILINHQITELTRAQSLLINHPRKEPTRSRMREAF